MKERKYTSGMTVSFGAKMYAQLSDEAHRRHISRSQLVREALAAHFRTNGAGQEELEKVLEKADGLDAVGE